MEAPLLEVSNLQIKYGGSRPVIAVDGVSFQLQLGDNLGLVGESGCGKTTLAKSLLGLLPRNGSVAGGSIRWDGVEVTRFTEKEWNRLRWADIAIIPQNALNSLNPVYRLRDQIVEAIRAHKSVSVQEARQQADQLCRMVGIDPERLLDYPHQLSGGMRQRLVIGMALALKPRLIIADEPTTALDVIVQDRIIRQIVDLQREFRFAMIYISHDIGVIAETCHLIAVIYAGKIAEYGSTRDVLNHPIHPYTMGLKNAFPEIRVEKPLISIPGHPPSLASPPTGCRFASRCPFVGERCLAEEPRLVEHAPGQYAACHYADRAPELRQLAARASTWQKVPAD
ncbi:MAG: ABC transporter ATP-binding protein [Anaerolineales bacterium]|nr:ABC transporter ATP-binding protein [Anaerolineales bacterium]